MSTLAGQWTAGFSNGTGAAAQFKSPQGIELVGGDLYVADAGNNAIRKVTTAGVVTTLAGDYPFGAAGYVDGLGTAARFSMPYGVTAATDGTLYVADRANSLIRKVTLAGAVTTFAGAQPYGYMNSSAPSVVYTGSALTYINSGLTVGTAYTYTVTATPPGSVSNKIGPFVP